MASSDYPRDLIGYGALPPHPRWPQGARIAVQFVLNYEEGGEANILHGDQHAESYLHEVVGSPALPNSRNLQVESVYEYGSRAGVWRVLRLAQEFGIPLTIFAVAMALERHPALARELVGLGHEIASHGWRWIDYHGVDETTEREHIALAVEAIRSLTGSAPLGWYTGRTSENTRRLVVEHGGFLYDADSYSDDLPYWETVGGKPHLIVPYTLDTNDMRFVAVQGFNSGEQFFNYLKDAFDVLYAEGESAPKMLSVGLHCRLVGRPARLAALARFLDYAQGFERVWICRRIDIARHWIARHPWQPPA
jgi:allantoinase